MQEYQKQNSEPVYHLGFENGQPVPVTEEVFREEMGQAFLPGDPVSGSPLTAQVAAIMQIDSHELWVRLEDSSGDMPSNRSSYHLVVEAWGNKWVVDFTPHITPDGSLMAAAKFAMGSAKDWSLKPDRFDPYPGHPILYVESKDFIMPARRIANVGWWPSEYGDHCSCAVMYVLVPDEPPLDEYRLQIWADPERGAVTKTPEKETYRPEEKVWLNAVTYQNWRFLTWRGEIETSENPVEFTMPAYDCTVGAVFEAENGDEPDLEKVDALITGARVDMASADLKLMEAQEELDNVTP